jgi:hypothetical protein
MLVTLLVTMAAFTLVFLGLFWIRYSLEVGERTWHAARVRAKEAVT